MLGNQQQGTNLVLVKKLDRMRAELGWNESSKLERILIERVCQTWLYLHWLEMVDAQSKILFRFDARRLRDDFCPWGESPKKNGGSQR